VGAALVQPGPYPVRVAQACSPPGSSAASPVRNLGTGPTERQVTLVVGGSGSASTDVIVDVTGYFKWCLEALTAA
jgi:hypothetical protein